jgi:hypothetical protein
MHYRLMFPTEFLCAADLKGRDVTVTISKISREQLVAADGGKEPAWIVEFAEMQKRPKDQRKRWVLNVTNAKTIAKLHGADAAEWTEKQVTLFPTTCLAWGETVECIRVRPQRPAPKSAPLPPLPVPETGAPSPDELTEFPHEE